MSKFNPDKHHRGSIRLEGYDYSCPGAYFVTICAQGRACLFGDTVDCTLNDAGKMVSEIWKKMPLYHAGIGIDAYVVMPNHFHAVVVFGAHVGAAHRGRPSKIDNVPGLTLSALVNRFKTLTTKMYIDAVKCNTWPGFSGRLWQRNYYERIIRNDIELAKIRQYIQDNPERWNHDEENPMALIDH